MRCALERCSPTGSAKLADAGARAQQPKKLYKILSVSPDARGSEIKKVRCASELVVSCCVLLREVLLCEAYRELALRYHPDKCAEPSAETVFKIVGEAYDTLCDDSRRAAYDRSCSLGSRSAATDEDYAWQRRWGHNTRSSRSGGRYR